MKYAFINQHSGSFCITSMCKAMGVSRGGYYDWSSRQKQESPRQQRQALLDQEVKAAFETRKKRAGSPTLTVDLKEKGFAYDRKTVAESMRRQGLRAKAAKKFIATTNSDHNLPVAPFSSRISALLLPTRNGWEVLSAMM